MEYIAESKNVKMSPRKVRLVVDGIKHLGLTAAINNLHGLNKRAATPVRKTLESAAANAVNNFSADKMDLSIKEILVNEGIMYKRFHYAARGRVRPYKRRTSHIRVILSDNRLIENPVTAVAPKEIENKPEVQTSAVVQSAVVAEKQEPKRRVKLPSLGRKKKGEEK